MCAPPTEPAPSGRGETAPAAGAGRPPAPPADPPGRGWLGLSRAAWLWVLAGVGVRALLLVLAGDTALSGDEAHQLYLAAHRLRFGFLGDAERYLWPPGYTLLLAGCLDAFGAGGIAVLRALQVALSAAVGWGVLRLAAQAFGGRAVHAAGLLWALHLPLAVYTHLGWPEPLFLAILTPALALAVDGACPARGARSADRRLLAAGFLLGGAALVKEIGVPIAALVAVALFLALRRGGAREALRRAALVPLAAAAVLAPWAARNALVYGHVVPSGATLGENAYHGLNAHDHGFDLRELVAFHPEGERVRREIATFWVATDPGGRWQRADEIPNTIERSRENLRRGLAWVRGHPLEFLRTRVGRLADLVTPLSVFLRKEALGAYPGPLGAPALRRPLVVLSLLTSMLVLALAPAGLFAWRGPGRGIVLAVVLAVLAAGSLVAMSRFRLPAEPLLVALAGGALASPRRLLPRERRARLALVLTWLVLLSLWLVAYDRTAVSVELAW